MADCARSPEEPTIGKLLKVGEGNTYSRPPRLEDPWSRKTEP
jgi:hypothetical protein